MGLYIKPPMVSRSSPDCMAKTIHNNLNKDAKDIIKTLRERYTNITNDVNTYYVKNSICKMVNDLDENARIDQIIKCKYT